MRKNVVLLLIPLAWLFSCSEQPEASKDLSQEEITSTDTSYFTNEMGDTIKTGGPIAAKSFFVPPDSIQKTKTIPLLREPKVILAPSNTYLAGKPKINIAKKTKSYKELVVPQWDSSQVQGIIVKATHPKPVPVEVLGMSENASYNFQFMKMEHGMSSNLIKPILADNQGHLWFGTHGKGITRFDGKNLWHFAEIEGINHYQVWYMKKDQLGNIWIGFWDQGIIRYDGQNFTRFTKENGLRSNSIRALFVDSKGYIWIGTGNRGISCLIPSSDRTSYTVINYHKEKGLKTNVFAITEDNKGNIWFGTEKGVSFFDGKKFTWYTTKEGLCHDQVKAILADSKGNIWFGSYGGGLCQFDGYKFSQYTKAQGLSDDRIMSIMEDEGDLWLGTEAGGACHFDGKQFTHYTIDEGMSSNNVQSILKDPQENLWFTTWGGGVNKLGNKGLRFFSPRNDLNRHISSITEDKKGDLWFGTGGFHSTGGGVIRYDGKSFTQFTKEQGLFTNEVQSIMEDQWGNLWFSSWGGMVSRYNPIKKEITNLRVKYGSIWSMLKDSKNRLWFAGTNGLARYEFLENGESAGITRFLPYKNFFSWGNWSIMENQQGNFWFGTWGGGVTLYDPLGNKGNGTFTNFTKKDGLNHNTVYPILNDHNDNYWFGCWESGISHFNGKKFSSITKKDGLVANSCTSILEDKKHNIWVSGEGGISLITPVLVETASSFNVNGLNYKIYSFDNADGFKNLMFDLNSGTIDSKNRIWWGGEEGLTMLDVNKFKLPTEPPKNVSLSHIEIQQQFLDYRSLSDTTYSNTLAFGNEVNQSFDSITSFYNYPQNLKLPYDLNHLTFHFTAIDWAAPHKIKYSYYLEGLEKDWSTPQTEPKADYRNLPHGNFTLKVRAIGEAQVWSDNFEYTFKILPPWWHTWWAYGLYALCIFGASGWYIQRLRKQINQKQAQLQKEQYLNQELAVTNKQLADINVANSRFVPNDFLQILGKESLLDLQLGDQTAAKMTILFADIRDYTTMSETMTPEQNFKFINAFLGRMGPIIKANGGFICQYFGDGIMALFKENHHLAIKAAIEMQQKIGFYNVKRIQQERQIFKVGIGLNTGQLMLGVIGDKERYDSSVISDAVNTAARMEGLTKIFGCMLIISESTLQELLVSDTSKVSDTLDISSTNVSDTLKVSDTVAYRFLGKVKVKGKHIALKIYDLYEGDSKVIKDLKNQTKTNFEKAMHLYFEKEFGKAADLLKIVLEIHSDDKAANYYFEKALQYVVNGVEATWSGVEEMVSK